MKYLTVLRGCNEPDNNTPSSAIWARVIECEPTELNKYESVFENDFAEDYPMGVEITFVPLDVVEKDWAKTHEIW